MINRTRVQQLNDIYFNEETWHENKETLAGITNYHQIMLDNGSLLCYGEGEQVLGYVEFWLINRDQLDIILRNEKFIAPFEDIKSGDICFVANLWIRNDHRKGRVIKELKKDFDQSTKKAKYFCGMDTKDRRFKLYKKGV